MLNLTQFCVLSLITHSNSSSVWPKNLQTIQPDLRVAVDVKYCHYHNTLRFRSKINVVGELADGNAPNIKDLSWKLVGIARSKTQTAVNFIYKFCR